MDKRIVMSLAFVVGIISVAGATSVQAQSNIECTGPTAERRAEITKWIGLFDKSELAYNDLWKAIARAGHAPAGYISPNVSPGINQGVGVTDSLDGQTILRADLYYAHDEAAKARQACRNLDCGGYTLPSAHSGAQSALTKYINAMEAMPKFAGPSGMMLSGSPQRMMNMHDARVLSEELTKTYSCQSDTGTPAAPATPTTPVTPPATPTGTYTLAYVTELLTQIQTLTNKVNTLTSENASLRSQLAAAKSQASYAGAQNAQSSSAAAASASSGSCPVLARSLSQGASGFDVSTLQSFLAKDPSIYPEGLVTAYFGPATERAVGRWQLQKGVVASAADTGYGSAGPRTRAALLATCQ